MNGLMYRWMDRWMDGRTDEVKKGKLNIKQVNF